MITKMASVQVTESVRRQWNRYCRKNGRLMKDYTTETLRAIMRGEYIRVPKKPVKFEIVEQNDE